MKNSMAQLWVQKITEGKKAYADVPRQLKEPVRKILTENGAGHLAEEGDHAE